MKKYILGLDEGTTSARAVVYDIAKNKILTKCSQPIKQIYPHKNWVEQDALQIIDAQFKAVSEALLQAQISADELCAIAITNQRESIVAWDSQTSQPIYNSICWQDKRTIKDIENLPEAYKKRIKLHTGLIPDPYFSASKMAWILNNVPNAKKLVKLNRLRIGTIDSYLTYVLTGKFVTDTTNASRTMLMNIKTLSWDEEMLKIWGIPEQCLPTIVDSDCIVGNCPKLGNAPLCAIIGDQQSSLYGQNCINLGDTKATYGTGGFILINTGESIVENKKLLSTVAYTINGKTNYALEGSIYSACNGIEWLRSMGIIESASQTEKLSNSLQDTNGVYFVPAFNGLGAPYWNSKCNGILCGISLETTPSHVARAMLESMAYNTKDILNQSRLPIKQIRVDGGGSKNQFLLQFLADMCQTKVTQYESESTVMGTIKIAQSHFCIAPQLCEKQTFLPRLNITKVNKLYNGWQKAVKLINK